MRYATCYTTSIASTRARDICGNVHLYRLRSEEQGDNAYMDMNKDMGAGMQRWT